MKDIRRFQRKIINCLVERSATEVNKSSDNIEKKRGASRTREREREREQWIWSVTVIIITCIAKWHSWFIHYRNNHDYNHHFDNNYDSNSYISIETNIQLKFKICFQAQFKRIPNC